MNGKSMIILSNKNVIYSMSQAHKPVAICQSGDMVNFETLDCFSNMLIPQQAQLGVDTLENCNPATGPLLIQGAVVGDTLKIEILDIQVGELGVTIIGPSSESYKKRILNTEVKRITVANGHAQLTDKLSLPIEPMIGVIGVAPEKASVPTAVPGEHGGNLDCKKIKKGAVVYLPVFVEGALLSIGDLHALMGDGEVGECGLEIEGSVTIKVTVLSGLKRTSPNVLTDGCWYTLASAQTLDQAADLVIGQMLDFLIDEIGIEASEAAVLVGLCGNLEICQVCNELKTVRMGMPLNCFDSSLIR